MRFVGGQELSPTPGDHGLIASGFSKMPQQTRHVDTVARFVGYESLLQGSDRVRFFGIEVGDIEEIPDGMVAWDLGETDWTIWESRGGQDVMVWQEEITWMWLDRFPSKPGARVGEFTAQGPAEWSRLRLPRDREFWMFANAYTCAARSDFRDGVNLADYDPSWPERYEEMACWLRNSIGLGIALRVEHYGSTAIPGMSAKPIIDVLVEVPSFRQAKERVLPCMNGEAWEYWWYSDHMVFIKRTELMGERTHHIHLAPRGHDIWGGIAFRDYLRLHPGDAARYAELKRQLVQDYRDDRERYTNAKEVFVEEITSKALSGLAP